MASGISVPSERYWRLVEDNAKLRELVHDFALLTDDAVSHWGIELEAVNSTEAPPAEWKECLYELDMLVNRMHELGIEIKPCS